MGGSAISALARLTERRFQSFSEAAEAVLDLLEAELPADAILLGQLDWDESLFRVMEARGSVPGVETGSTLPLAARHEGQNGTTNGLLDPDSLRALAVRSYLALPFETSDGSGAITLCALGTHTNLFTRAHLELIAVTGRLLTYEWESVRWRADLRRMSEQLRDPKSTDPVTGLPNRESFVPDVDREWRLAQRGSVESYVLVCRVADLDAVRERTGEAISRLLLKDMAEVLVGAIRRTDHIGRTADDELAVVLVGCKGKAGADAFFERFQESFGRVTSGRPDTFQVTYGVRELGPASSGEEAFDQASTEAREAVPIFDDDG
jgi:diguanylate cyclase (GGDEF)-like protein